MIRRLLAFYAATLGCFAQYATTDDGSKLFFTSYDRLAGSNQSFRSKLFSWDSMHGVQLVYESPTEYVIQVTITGDGSLAAATLSTADDPPQSRGVLIDLHGGLLQPVGKTAIISRNGRFLFDGDRLIDRIAGTSRPVSIQPTFVGSDGSILYSDGRNLHRIDPNGADRVVAGGLRSGHLAGTDENTARAIVSFGPGQNFIIDTVTGIQTDLRTFIPAAALSSDYPLLSGDGQWVAFQVILPGIPALRAVLCRSDGTGCKFPTSPLTNQTPIAIDAVGGTVYARSAYAALSPNRVLHIDANTGQTEQAFAIASFSPFPNKPIVPGSLVRFNVVNAGNHITANGRDLPFLSSSAGLPIVQIPWDLNDQWVKFTMYGGDSPFETFTQTYPISDFFPEGFAPGSPGLNEGQPAYRQDWSATTYESPASPGEIVHIYAVGLGATDCSIETGEPAPVDRLCRILRPVAWQWTTAPGTTVPGEVLFAGLAPGMIGLYQIDVRAPLFNGYEFIEFSDGSREPFVAGVRIGRP